MKQSKFDEIFSEFLREAYLKSTPSTSYDLLVENAFVDDKGEKHIDYNSCSIDNELFDKIIDFYIKKYKMNKFDAKMFHNSAYLGPSPKFTKK